MEVSVGALEVCVVSAEPLEGSVDAVAGSVDPAGSVAPGLMLDELGKVVPGGAVGHGAGGFGWALAGLAGAARKVVTITRAQSLAIAGFPRLGRMSCLPSFADSGKGAKAG
ncbi:MAG TPA: hypothetical protein VG276_16815 [Actinomycetes bacterium]|nr:hypothetical protein [Actinomycetes bacterium]